MTESLRNKVDAIYADLRFVVDKGPGTIIGEPILMILNQLLTQAKDSGGDAKLCDALLSSLGRKSTAADALAVAGQLRSIVSR